MNELENRITKIESVENKPKVEVVFQPKVISCEVYSIEDIQKKLDCSYSVAQRKMREVKAVSDVLGITGIIHEYDWQTWLKYRAEVTYKKGLPASCQI